MMMIRKQKIYFEDFRSENRMRFEKKKKSVEIDSSDGNVKAIEENL